jgi:uncharacterized protein YndB with AHSA1/START domain
MTPEKEVTFERVYDAPVERVWAAWTDPAQLKQWWGPNDVDIDECEVDLRVGGRLYIVMVAGEAMGQFKGTRWPMEAEYTFIEENKQLSYKAKAWTEGKEEATQIDQLQEILFSSVDGKTKMNLKATILKTGPDAGGAVEGMSYGYNQQLDKLISFLASD